MLCLVWLEGGETLTNTGVKPTNKMFFSVAKGLASRKDAVYPPNGYQLEGKAPLIQVCMQRLVHVTACNQKQACLLHGVLVRGVIKFRAIRQVCCSLQPCYVPVGC